MQGGYSGRVTAQQEKGLGSPLSTLSSGLRTTQEFAVSSERSCNFHPKEAAYKQLYLSISALHLCHLPIMSPHFPMFLR